MLTEIFLASFGWQQQQLLVAPFGGVLSKMGGE